MCGIIGASWEDREGVMKAAKLFGYRGPDHCGLFSDGRVTLGHDRLSIVDLDARSHQPMADESGELEIVFNGEIFNHLEIRERLQGKYRFRTTSDTETIIQAYREYGGGLGRQLKGMFAFGIYDTKKRKIILYRDHAGIKPLYYYFDGKRFAFASELKGLVSLTRDSGAGLTLDGDALDLYACFGYIPSPGTLYKEIKKLQPGFKLEFDLDSRNLALESFPKETVECADVASLKVLIEDRVMSHLMADVPVGVFFSGGTDSSLIASILHKHKVKLATYSVRMQGKPEDEEYFNKINSYLGLECRVFDFSPKDFAEAYDQVASRLDEPLADSSIFPTYFISQKAAQDVKVVLSGEGGDEYFYGYGRQVVLSRMSLRTSTIGKVLDAFALGPLSRPWVRKLYSALGDAAGYYLFDMSPFSGAVKAAAWSKGRERILASGHRPIDFDKKLYLENDLLRKIDLATSYNSIEGRVPLLDEDICRNAEKFEGLHLRGGVLKSLLKEILADYLPKELVYRGKSGFGLDASFARGSSLEADAQRGFRLLAEAGSIRKETIKNQRATFAAALLYRALKNLGEA